MKFTCLLFLAALGAWAQPAPATAAAGDPVVLTIGTETFTKSQFELILATLPEQQRAAAQSPEGRRKIAEQFAELKLLAQAARAQKLDETPLMRLKMSLSADQVLAGSMYQALGTTIDDAALHAYYDAHKADFETAKARHILITMKGSRAPFRPGQKELTEEEALAKAKDLHAKLLAGADFGALAKAESDDVGSGEQGGELGEFGHGAMVKEFEDAAFVQPLGKVGEPVKTAFGYHLIIVDSRSAKPFDEVRSQIVGKIGPEQAKKGLDDLRKKTPPVLDDSYFGK